MCHDPSRPPVPPADAVHDRRELDRSGDLRLTSTDGARLLAYEAVPTGRPWGRVVVLPDVRGLHPYYVALAERFAEAGSARGGHRLLRADGGGPAPRRGLRRQAAHPADDPARHADITAAMRHLAPDGAGR